MEPGHETEPLPGSVTLWRELGQYLIVAFEVGYPTKFEDSHRRATFDVVPVAVHIENSAPDLPDWPSIIFMGISLRSKYTKTLNPNFSDWSRTLSTTRPDRSDPRQNPDHQTGAKRLTGAEFQPITNQEEQWGDVLFPGESMTYEISVPTDVMPYIEFHVDAGVSRKLLFRYERHLEMPEEYTRPPAVSAIRAFNEINLHEPLASIAAALSSFGPDTKLKDLQAVVQAVSRGSDSADTVRSRLNESYRLAPNPDIGRHVHRAYEYIDHLQAAFGELRTALASSDSEAIEQAVSALRIVDTRADQLNSRTEELLLRYGLSDVEAGYHYRKSGTGSS